MAKAMRSFYPAYSPHLSLSGYKFFHPCLFLDNRKGRCRIYEVRPLICRLYGYCSSFGDCIKARDTLSFCDPVTDKCVSKYAPLVYWLGDGGPILEKQESKDLFLVANEGAIYDYIHFSIHLDFDDWFAF